MQAYSRAASPVSAAPLTVGDVQLPTIDIRASLDARAFRRLTESSRRAVRITGLLLGDIISGLLGIATIEATWYLVSGGGRRPLPDVVPLVAMVVCLQPLALCVTGAYAGGKARSDFLKIAGGVGIAALLGWGQAQLFGRDVPDMPNKAAYLYAAAVIVVYAWGFRMLVGELVAMGYRAGVLQRRVLVLGSAAEVARLNEACRATPDCDFRVVGRLSDVPDKPHPLASMPACDVPFLGTIDDLEGILAGTHARSVIVASNLPFAHLEAVAGRCFRLGATLSILPHALKELSASQIEVRQTTVGSLLQLRPVRLAVPQLLVKRAMDVTLTVAALTVLWPLLLLISALIKLDSRGPVFFRQSRAGVGGRPFVMLKFRTMREGADDEKRALASLNESGDPRFFKIRQDPRVTRLGRVLRRTSVDELPQLLNVLKGDMSLVGPRPFFPHDLAGYARHHFERLHVLPGITGLWQVSGRSDVADFEEVIRLDREYIQNWSVVSDIGILLRTIPAAFGRGAY